MWLLVGIFVVATSFVMNKLAKLFCEGEEFASYAELKDNISEFERMEFVQLNVQRSKSIEAARRRAPTKNYKDDLKYSAINLVRMYTWRERFKTTSKGERTGQW